MSGQQHAERGAVEFVDGVEPEQHEQRDRSGAPIVTVDGRHSSNHFLRPSIPPIMGCFLLGKVRAMSAQPPRTRCSRSTKSTFADKRSRCSRTRRRRSAPCGNSPPSTARATYLVYEDRRYTYAQTHEIVNAFAAHLVSLGVQKGDRVAIAMRNLPEFPMAFWAASVDRRGRRAAERVVDRSRARLRVVRLGRARAHRRRRATRADQAAPERDRGRARLHRRRRIPRPRRCPTSTSTPRTTPRSCTRRARPGKPKGAVGTHRNFCAHVMNAMYGALDSARPRPTTSAAAAERAGAASRDRAHVPAVPRRRAAVVARAAHGGRRQDRAALQVGHAEGARPHRAGRDHASWRACRRRCSKCSTRRSGRAANSAR